LAKFLQSINPSPVVSLPVSNDVLLKERFYPLRLVENDFTCPGILQLAPNSVVLLDERPLVEGNVNAINVVAINKAVRDQELIGIYGGTDFINFPINLKFVVFNKDQAKSMFSNANPSSGVNGTVPFAHLVANPSETSTSLSDKDISLSHDDRILIQSYINTCQSIISDILIPDDVVKKFENEWVESRKVAKNIPTDDIHVWATLIKVMAASHGKAQVQPDDVDSVLNLEAHRRDRITPINNENSIHFAENMHKVAVNGA
jgi:hypothetical protein